MSSRTRDVLPAPNGRLEATTHRLLNTFPEFSASRPPTRAQTLASVLAVIGLAIPLILAPQSSRGALLFLISLSFMCVAALRFKALFERDTQKQPALKPASEVDADLPLYTLLVPLYREAEIVQETIAALSRLHYPKDKLEILFLLEEDDARTRAAFHASTHASNMRAIAVPRGDPRTKPRALCYGMSFAKGDYIAVYDAEDLPDPEQLHRVLRHFRDHQDTGCVQACLSIDNWEKNWLTHQFAIEYAALFDALLPAFQRWEFPIPLGGTSNHFPRSVLQGAGGWDPYNVTEDADLGIRLARLGWRVRTDTSTTWEEAPAGLKAWLHQRTRWIKGWIQTYLVHMRAPLRTWRDLGTRSFVGLQLLMVSQVLSPIIHPWALLLTIIELAVTMSGEGPSISPLHGTLMAFAWINLLAGYGSGMALGYRAAKRRGFTPLSLHIASMPLYWLLISVAAHRAWVQAIAAPFLWEKTPHLGRRRSQSRETSVS